MRLTNSVDGVKRIDVRLESRLSLDDLAYILTSWVSLSGNVEEVEGKNYVDTIKIIRSELQQYGESAIVRGADSDDSGEIFERMRRHLAKFWE